MTPYIILKMEENENICEKERERRRKISEARKKAIEEKRRKGYRAFIAKRRREKRKAETLKRREKEKEKKKRLKEKERERKKSLKKPGRKKLRGRKKVRYKKVLVKQTRALPEIKYKIISCRNGVQNKFIGGYRTGDEAYKIFRQLRKEDKDVVFPVMVTGSQKQVNSIDEYILIKKSDEKGEGLRNEYGKIVEQRLNIEGWVVVDKFRYKKEETFWVWGYNAMRDRKTFQWIYENIVTNSEGASNERIKIYKNKLIIKHDNAEIDLIICKNISDCIRFYNKLEEYCKKDKIKFVFFLGDYSNSLERRKLCEKEIEELTGWDKRKIKKNATVGS